jgi:hypothetical protein
MLRRLDFTVMYAAHDAFRRDTDRLRDAAAAHATQDPSVLSGWQTFKRQLAIHHAAEDTALWPKLRAALVRNAADTIVLDVMQEQHRRLEALLAAVDEALRDGDHTALALGAEELAAALDDHLEQEEELALPLIQAMLTEQDWAAFDTTARRLQGRRGIAVFLPWLLDGTPLSEQRRLLSLLPARIRVGYRALWRPRYLAKHLWAFPVPYH